jgi:hypothetical protein
VYDCMWTGVPCSCALSSDSMRLWIRILSCIKRSPLNYIKIRSAQIASRSNNQLAAQHDAALGDQNLFDYACGIFFVLRAFLMRVLTEFLILCVTVFFQF